jgi:hypothetical protein
MLWNIFSQGGLIQRGFIEVNLEVTERELKNKLKIKTSQNIQSIVLG